MKSFATYAHTLNTLVRDKNILEGKLLQDFSFQLDKEQIRYIFSENLGDKKSSLSPLQRLSFNYINKNVAVQQFDTDWDFQGILNYISSTKSSVIFLKSQRETNWKPKSKLYLYYALLLQDNRYRTIAACNITWVLNRKRE